MFRICSGFCLLCLSASQLTVRDHITPMLYYSRTDGELHYFKDLKETQKMKRTLNNLMSYQFAIIICKGILQCQLQI